MGVPRPRRFLCVLCGTGFLESTVSREHLLPTAIGFRTNSRTSICSGCNASTKWADEAIAHSVEWTTQVLNPAGRTRRLRPLVIRGGDVPLLMHAGGRISLPREHMVSDGDDQFHLIDSAHWPEFEARMTRKGRRAVRTVSLQGIYTTWGIDWFEQDVNLPNALAKAALHYLHRNKVRIPAADRELIQSVAQGRARLPRSMWSWDYDLDVMAEDRVYSGLEIVACPDTGLLSCRIHIYGLIRVRIIISQTYRGSRHGCYRLVEYVDDTTPASSRTSCRHPSPLAYQTCPRQPYSLRQAMSWFSERIAPSVDKTWDHLDQKLVAELHAGTRREFR